MYVVTGIRLRVINVHIQLFDSVKPFSQHGGNFMGDDSKASMLLPGHQGASPSLMAPPWEGRSIATPKLRLVELSGYVQQHTDTDAVSTYKF